MSTSSRSGEIRGPAEMQPRIGTRTNPVVGRARKSARTLWNFFFGRPFVRCGYCRAIGKLDRMTKNRLGYFCNPEEAMWFGLESGLALSLVDDTRAIQPVKNGLSFHRNNRGAMFGRSSAR